MGDAVLYFEDVSEGDEAPVRSHVLTRTDLVAYAGRVGRLQPDAPRRGHWRWRPVSPASSVTGCSRWASSARPSPTTWASGTSAGSRCGSRKQTWPDEKLVRKIVVTGKRAEGDDHLVDLDVRLRQRGRRGEGGRRGDRPGSRPAADRALGGARGAPRRS